jgi:hypothetical protein
MEGLTKIEVAAGDKVDFETTSWGYVFNANKKMIEQLYVEVDPETGEEKPSWNKPEDSSKYSAPKDVFGDQLTVLSLRKLPNIGNEEFYQIYAQLESSDGITFHLSRVTFKRTPPAETPADEPVTEPAPESDPEPISIDPEINE